MKTIPPCNLSIGPVLFPCPGSPSSCGSSFTGSGVVGAAVVGASVAGIFAANKLVFSCGIAGVGMATVVKFLAFFINRIFIRSVDACNVAIDNSRQINNVKNKKQHISKLHL